MTLEPWLETQPHRGNVVGANADSSFGLGIDGLARRFVRATPGTLGHSLELLTRHVAEHFVIDARDESTGASELPGPFQSLLGDAAFQLHRRVCEVAVPKRNDCDVEENGDYRCHWNVDRCRKSDRGREKDVDRILAVVECVAKAHRGDDAGKTECQRKTVLHQHHDAGDDQR